ncbi:MAG: hypothetical protein PVH91_05985 [Pseudomonadales bacterium]|jgi:hypothetical protein
MRKQDSKPHKPRKRRATATIGGTTQSTFANRSMSEVLKQKKQKKQDGQEQNEAGEDREAD